MTYYDDATGERIELSASTLANWAAKTANMVRDEFALEPGGKVAVLLPAHWQSVAVLLGVWWAGGEVVLSPDADAELAFVTADRLDDVADVPEVAALSPRRVRQGFERSSTRRRRLRNLHPCARRPVP